MFPLHTPGKQGPWVSLRGWWKNFFNTGSSSHSHGWATLTTLRISSHFARLQFFVAHFFVEYYSSAPAREPPSFVSSSTLRVSEGERTAWVKKRFKRQKDTGMNDSVPIHQLGSLAVWFEQHVCLLQYFAQIWKVKRIICQISPLPLC